MARFWPAIRACLRTTVLTWTRRCSQCRQQPHSCQSRLRQVCNTMSRSTNRNTKRSVVWTMDLSRHRVRLWKDRKLHSRHQSPQCREQRTCLGQPRRLSICLRQMMSHRHLFLPCLQYRRLDLGQCLCVVMNVTSISELVYVVSAGCLRGVHCHAIIVSSFHLISHYITFLTM